MFKYNEKNFDNCWHIVNVSCVENYYTLEICLVTIIHMTRPAICTDLYG